MSVELDICNSTLIKLGATPISDLLDDVKEARLLRLQYPKIRDAVLRTAPWSFATRRRVLTALDPAPAEVEFIDGTEFVFQLPVECVKLWKILYQPNVKYKVEGRYIIANEATLNVWYIRNTAPVDNYDAAFKEAVANMLAADLCYSLTQSTTLKQSLEGTAQFFINEARSYNSQEGTPDKYQFDQFLDSRVGGRAVYD